MPTTDSGLLDDVRKRSHPRCVVCGAANPIGLNLQFTVTSDKKVEALFHGNELLEGYPGRLHGGLIATLLDAAMTHCLFAHGRQAVTAEMTVRYRQAVLADRKMILRASLLQSRKSLHHLQADLLQENQVKASARAKFLELAAVGTG
jgi:uncharacterized protein (TIGR00369 family)